MDILMGRLSNITKIEIINNIFNFQNKWYIALHFNFEQVKNILVPISINGI